MNASKSLEHNSSNVGPVTLNKKPFADVHTTFIILLLSTFMWDVPPL